MGIGDVSVLFTEDEFTNKMILLMLFMRHCVQQ